MLSTRSNYAIVIFNEFYHWQVPYLEEEHSSIESHPLSFYLIQSFKSIVLVDIINNLCEVQQPLSPIFTPKSTPLSDQISDEMRYLLYTIILSPQERPLLLLKPPFHCRRGGHMRRGTTLHGLFNVRHFSSS